MKKKPPLSIRYCAIRFGSKIFISLSIILCLFALFKLNYPSRLQSSLAFSVLRARKLDEQHYNGPPKIAFLFLTRKDLPLDFLWGYFFQNADVKNFSIYIHSEPGFVFDEMTSRSPFFYSRQLRKSVQVVWGESSMIEAERMLLGEALEDPANQRFVLLSDSCVPLYNFSYIYHYLMSSPRSFVDSFFDVKDGRYNPKMSSVIRKAKWRKGSQWITLIRRHAQVVVDDDILLPVFKRYCKRRPPIDPTKGKKLNDILQMQHNCIPDEHYVQTLLAMSDIEDELERRTVTYTMWNQSSTTWHPVTFSYASASPQKIKGIKAVNNVYYPSEYRTEWCKTNSTFVSCFLFARKFSRGAAMRLLSEGEVGSLDSDTLVSMES